MADNYLERRMADYRDGRIKASAQARRATVSAAEKSQPTVFILGGETATGIKNINYFRNLGWRVAFTHSDLSEGRRIAQTSGAQHHPINPADNSQLCNSLQVIADRWGHLDLILNFTGHLIKVPNGIESPLFNISE